MWAPSGEGITGEAKSFKQQVQFAYARLAGDQTDYSERSAFRTGFNVLPPGERPSHCFMTTAENNRARDALSVM